MAVFSLNVLAPVRGYRDGKPIFDLYIKRLLAIERSYGTSYREVLRY